MSNIEHISQGEEDQESFDPARAAQQSRRSLIWLVALVIIAFTMLFLARPLFNNYWDPALSSTVISH